MRGRVVGLIGGSALVVAVMMLPFMPGPYDRLATGLSMMARVFAYAGLALVPFAAAWLALELRALANGPTSRLAAVGYWVALSAAGVLLLIGLLLSFAALSAVGPSLGVPVAIVVAWAIARLVRRLHGRRESGPTTVDPIPVYLVVLPLAAALGEFGMLGRVAELSRNRVIDNSAAMIRDIERYRDTTGHYPRSLAALWKDYPTGVMGVEHYHYEPNGAAYNLYFEHVANALDTREIIMYNGRGEHEMTSHDSDLLLRTPGELARMRGYYAVRDAGRPRWKRFWFD